MRKLLVLITLFASLSGLAENQCGYSTPQGGVDVFPWSQAQPFAWDNIQGLWQVNDFPDTFLRLRVIRANQSVKQLKVELLSKIDCAQPLMTGSGFINYSEKNVVRIFLKDKSGHVRFLKLGYFNPSDLKLSQAVCGQRVLIASVIEPLSSQPDQRNENEMSESIFMLEKVTSSLGFSCKKQKN